MGAPIDAAMRPHAACRWLTEGLSFVTGKSGHRSPGYDPSHRLAGDLRDQLVVTVVVQNGDTFSFGHCRDQQVGQADRPQRHKAACTSSARRQSSSWVASHS